MSRYDSIPDELKALRQWVCASGGSKVPLQPETGRAASSTDPATWTSFERAREAVSRGAHDYCGFVFADNGYVGVDIDAGVDGDGLLTPLAADILSRCASYTEKSRSGRGFHVILRGELPFKGRNNLAGVELYKSSRYFIMTGEVLLYRTIVENQPALDYILEKYFRETPRGATGAPAGQRVYSPVWEPPAGGRIRLRPRYPRIPDGSRNLCLTSLAGALRNLGYSREQLYAELALANEAACDPPLERWELRTICNSVARYERP